MRPGWRNLQQKPLIMVNLSLIFFGWDTVKIGIVRAKAQFSV